ncbi:hypothetical protein BSL78_02259 [Apostichopus japonicus]|uniref:EamA domain-containing protein n=1 Tax=Stichopus japonicus TaxID=307972 RepID=A0A2G8LKJ5_STIJA|nr:hypothetical protein BSL78_02259 [Apostichopus japonicus]
MAAKESVDKPDMRKSLPEANTGLLRDMNQMDKERMAPASRSDEKKPISQKAAPWQRISDRKGLIFAIFCGISSCGQFIFGENIGLFFGFFFLNFIGIILLAKPPFLMGNVDSADINGDDFLGIMLAFAALMSVSLSLIPIRLLSHRGNCDSYLNIVIVGYVGMIISGVSLSITSGWAIKTDILHFIYLLIFTGFAFLTNLFAILAAEHEVIANVSVLIACSSLPLNFLAQVALFHQMVDIISITGLALIIGSTVGTI